MKLHRLLYISSLLFFLSACTTAPIIPVDWPQQQSRLVKLQQWSISGRLSVYSGDDGGQVDYAWRQFNATDYDIRLQAPLGAGTTWIKGREQGVSLRTSGGDVLFDTDVDRLLLRLNGWPIPVKGMYYWVRGIASPHSSFEIKQWSAAGQPTVMMQNGWRIEFKKQKMVKGFLLPGKLFISRQNENDDEVSVRLIIRQWLPVVASASDV